VRFRLASGAQLSQTIDAGIDFFEEIHVSIGSFRNGKAGFQRANGTSTP